ncbi:MAG TPA: FHA domain-containing protein [Candidatus Sulfomarinibacteraceae bacterium]|nr:FHA domain-containing protein [Candidatus Sulfomarinibacteraceae bacterium]
MSEQLTDALIRLGAAWCLVGLWLLTVAYVFWDARRRRLSDRQVARWMLVAALPFVGFLYYLVARRRQRAGRSDRVTLVRRSDEPPREGRTLSTVPAAFWKTSGGDSADIPLTLDVLEGPHAGAQFRLARFPARVGRTGDCQINLKEDLAVSRQHAELYRESGEVRLRDLGSTHGTFLNGYRVDDQPLLDGDTIQIGHTVFIVNERS